MRALLAVLVFLAAPVDGVQSNCMTCHQLAAWPNFSTNYQANGSVSPDDPAIFTGNLKLDFLWSVTRAQ